MASVIWLARHGTRQDFVDPTFGDHAPFPHDPPLAKEGIAEARRLGERLRGEGIGRVYASPFLRTVQTANEIAQLLGLPFRLEPGIGERMNRAWFPEAPRLHPIAELTAAYPRIVLDHRPVCVPSFPESASAAFARSALTARALASMGEDALLLVGHGASVTGAVMLLAGESVETPCPTAGLFKLVPHGGETPTAEWQVEIRAATAHLDAPVEIPRFF